MNARLVKCPEGAVATWEPLDTSTTGDVDGKKLTYLIEMYGAAENPQLDSSFAATETTAWRGSRACPRYSGDVERTNTRKTGVPLQPRIRAQ
jgi:hypothetical protein